MSYNISIVGATRAISEIVNTKFLDHFYSQLADFLTNDDEILRLGDVFLDSVFKEVFCV